MVNQNSQLMSLSHLDTMLARATRIDEITEVRAKIEALRVYAVNIGASKDKCQDFAMARIRAERKAGQVLLELPKRNGARPSDTGFIDATPQGVLPSQRNSWQTIARLPDDLFDDIMKERYDSKEDITTSYFYKASKIHTMRSKGVNTDRRKTITISTTDMARAAAVIRDKLSAGQITALISALLDR